MKVVMARIDDRLIHGQVLVGCCETLAIRRILLVSAELVADKTLREVYLSSVPSDIECRCVDAHTAVMALSETVDQLPTLVLAGSPAEMLDLVEAQGQIGDTICLGGLHHAPGRAEELDATGIFVGPEDLEALRRIRRHGIGVRVQPVPGARSIDLDDLLPAPDP